MWQDIINTGIGLIFGLLSGFYFERRNNKATRQHNAELERELAALRSSIYTVGGSIPEKTIPLPTRVAANGDDPDPLIERVHDRARQTQGADGRTSRTQLIAHFSAMGHPKVDVDSAISSLCERGQLASDGKWLEVR